MKNDGDEASERAILFIKKYKINKDLLVLLSVLIHHLLIIISEKKNYAVFLKFILEFVTEG